VDQNAQESDNLQAFSESDAPSDGFVDQKKIGDTFQSKGDGLSFTLVHFKLKPTNFRLIGNCGGFDKRWQGRVGDKQLRANRWRDDNAPVEPLKQSTRPICNKEVSAEVSLTTSINC
jgi:hypothetical protein